MSNVFTRFIPLLAVLGAGCSDTLTTSVAATDPTTTEALASISGSPGDRAAIEQIVRTFDQTWGDASQAAIYAGQYANAEWVGPSGVVLRDPAAITALYTRLFSSFFAGTTRQSTIRNLTFLTGTIAVLDIDARGSGVTTLPPGVVPWQPGTVRALEKNILVKRAGEWRIVQHQQTAVAPGVP